MKKTSLNQCDKRTAKKNGGKGGRERARDLTIEIKTNGWQDGWMVGWLGLGLGLGRGMEGEMSFGDEWHRKTRNTSEKKKNNNKQISFAMQTLIKNKTKASNQSIKQ